MQAKLLDLLNFVLSGPWWVKIAAGAIVIGIAVIVIAWLMQSKSSEVPENPTRSLPPKEAPTRSSPQNAQLQSSGNVASTGQTGGQTAGTILNVWPSQSDRNAGQHTELTERAYVTAASATLDYFGTERIIGIQVQIVNTGRTPARAVEARLIAGVGTYPLDKIPDLMPAPILSSSVLGAGQGMEGRQTLKIALDPLIVTNIKAGKQAIYLIGSVDYVDVFDKKHHSDFRFFFSGDNTSNGAMSFDRVGNEVR